MSLFNLSKILNDINNILVPPVCFGCNAHLIRGEEHLCTVCRNHLPLTEYNFNEENAIDRIFYGRIVVKKASSFLFFTENGIIQRLIHHLKYKNQEQIGSFLGKWYGQIIQKDSSLAKIDAVIPVPLHSKKLKKRGYNQVDLFAKELSAHLNALYLNDVLIKTANTRTQTKKGRLGRWQNSKALYTLSQPEKLKNKNILLVDDVITSGATMETCATALHEAEGITIYLTSMAVVQQFQ